MASKSLEETVEEQETHEQDAVKKAISPLQAALPSPSNSLRVSYERRLRSFSPKTYFAKPIEVSPILCARFGWENVGKDTLRCESCQKIWVVFIPTESLSTKALRWFHEALRPHLATAHHPACCFRGAAFKFLEQVGWKETANDCLKEKTESEIAKYVLPAAPIVERFPTALASLVPDKLLDLLEQPNPTDTFMGQWRDLLELTTKNKPFADYMESVDVPAKLVEWMKAPSKAIEEDLVTGEESIIKLIADLARKRLMEESANSSNAIPSNKLCQVAAALVLCGWYTWEDLESSGGNSISTPTDTSYDVIQSCCNLCLATWSVEGSSTTTDSTGTPSRPSKRIRGIPSHPWSKHRYYCPIIAGLSSDSTPLWEQTSRRLLLVLQKPKTMITEDFLGSENIHHMIRVGLSRKSMPTKTENKDPLFES